MDTETLPKARAMARMCQVSKPFDPEAHLPSQISRVATLIWQHTVRSYLAEYGLGIREWRVLTNIAFYQPISGNELAEYSGLDRGGISKAFGVLTNRGLIRREKDQRDGRRYFVYLTRKGADLYEALVPAAREREKQLVQVFSTTEREQLQELLLRLQHQLKAMLDKVSGRD